MKFEYSYRTDLGRKRSQNQDSGVACPDLGLFVVADGMGGHQGGEIASRLAVEVIPDSIRKARKAKRFDPSRALSKAIREANEAIFEQSRREQGLSGMGTTCTTLLFEGNHAYIGQVGDSRCYLMTPGNIWQVTRDHSLVQEKLKAGLITREQLKKDLFRNVITRSVGFEPVVNVDVYEFELNPRDQKQAFLLCSDGLSGPIDDSALLDIVNRDYFETGLLDTATQSLIARANDNGGDDNITVLIAHKVAK